MFSAICNAGEVSETGLEPCYPCPLGSYQPEFGQTFCLKCSPGMVTNTTGSSNINNCYEEPTVQELEVKADINLHTLFILIDIMFGLGIK